MRKIKLIYEIKSANGFWNRKEYITDDEKDYERVLNIICSNKDEYKIIGIELID